MFKSMPQHLSKPFDSYSKFVNWAIFFAKERAHSFFRFKCVVKIPQQSDYVKNIENLEGSSKYTSANQMRLSYTLPNQDLYEIKPPAYWQGYHMVSINHEISHLLDYNEKFQKNSTTNQFFQH